MKNLLIAFPNFSNNEFLKGSPDEWEIITAAELASKGVGGVFKFIRKQKYENFVIGRQDLSDGEIRIFLEGMIVLARAKNKRIVDNNNNEIRVKYGKFAWHLLKFFAELFIDIFIVFFAYVFWFLLRVAYIFSGTKKVGVKKIAYLRTDFFGNQATGGSFTHAQGFIKGVLNTGWEIFGVAQEKFFSQDIKFYKISYVKFHNSPEIPEVLYNLKYVFSALKALKKERPAFICQRHSFMNVAGAVLKFFLRVPFILEYNGSEAWIREKWGGKLFLKDLGYRLENLTLKFADGISVVSDVLKNELVEKGIDKNKVILNPNGVELDKFRPELDGEEIRRKYKLENKIVAGFLGTFGAWHGAEILAEAIRPVVASNSNIVFIMIGDGNLRPLVDKVISQNGVSDAVILPGIILHNEVPKYLAACDILVSPHIPNKDGTKFFGSPTKLFEYMAMGKGIVASDLEQIGKVLEHNKTAWLVEPGDVSDLAGGILKLANDKNLRELLGRNARQEVEKNYTWDKNAQRIINHYEGLF